MFQLFILLTFSFVQLAWCVCGPDTPPTPLPTLGQACGPIADYTLNSDNASCQSWTISGTCTTEASCASNPDPQGWSDFACDGAYVCCWSAPIACVGPTGVLGWCKEQAACTSPDYFVIDYCPGPNTIRCCQPGVVTPAPTTAFPTPPPTNYPTPPPSNSPTKAPSTSPTMTPTRSPLKPGDTHAPTPSPSPSPTPSPTIIVHIQPRPPEESSKSDFPWWILGLLAALLLLCCLLPLLFALARRAAGGKRSKESPSRSLSRRPSYYGMAVGPSNAGVMRSSAHAAAARKASSSSLRRSRAGTGRAGVEASSGGGNDRRELGSGRAAVVNNNNNNNNGSDERSYGALLVAPASALSTSAVASQCSVCNVVHPATNDTLTHMKKRHPLEYERGDAKAVAVTISTTTATATTAAAAAAATGGQKKRAKDKAARNEGRNRKGSVLSSNGQNQPVVNPLTGAISGASLCSVCGAAYPTNEDVAIHMRKRHATTSTSNNNGVDISNELPSPPTEGISRGYVSEKDQVRAAYAQLELTPTTTAAAVIIPGYVNDDLNDPNSALLAVNSSNRSKKGGGGGDGDGGGGGGDYIQAPPQTTILNDPLLGLMSANAHATHAPNNILDNETAKSNTVMMGMLSAGRAVKSTSGGNGNRYDAVTTPDAGAGATSGIAHYLQRSPRSHKSDEDAKYGRYLQRPNKL